MATAGIEVRRSNPSVATVWVAELLAAANRQADELENRKTHESIQQMFGKINSSPSNPKLSFEEMLCNKITKQKKKNTEKEKEYQMTLKSKKKKKEMLTNGVSKTEYISEKQKSSTLGSHKKPTPNIESIKSRLEDQSISRSARKKLKRKLKELRCQRETSEQEASSVQEKKKIHLQNKTKSGPPVKKKRLNLTNGHQPDISASLTNGHQPDISASLTNGHQPDISASLTNGHQTDISTSLTNGHQPDISPSLTNGHQPDISANLTNGHQECQPSTITNGFKTTNSTIHASAKRKETQPDGDDQQPPLKKSKLAKKLALIAELLKKKKKKKRSKQKNIKKDNRPDNMKPPHLQKIKTSDD